ncbi:MAG: hypothetical protein M3Z46_04480 [Actinomycetota bacterium]|nr:hypothetical protein [Actinomycetota bacterium]
MLVRLRSLDTDVRRWAIAGVVAWVALVPLLFFGPGNDLDVGNIFKSGRSIARHFHYKASRAPGAPVHETIAGVLDRLGGPLLTNLASLVIAAVLAAALFTLLRREGVRAPGLFAVPLVVLNPWFLIAATSTTDYLFALAFVLLAALALRTNRPVAAGVFAALSTGCRIGSGLLIISMLFAELWEGRPARRRVLMTGAVAVVGTLLLFVPAFVASGSSLKFADNDFSTSSPLVQAGRTLVKDMLLLGPIGSLLLLVALPPLFRAISTWRTSWLVRFAVPGLVLSEILFLRFPWKMPHLLPCLLCLAILLAVALDRRPALLYALVLTQVLYIGLRVDVIKPDDPNKATGGRVAVNAGWGPVVVDLRCRHEQPKAYLGRQKVEIERAWDCAKPFGG